jgi:hypothetical protein
MELQHLRAAVAGTRREADSGVAAMLDGIRSRVRGWNSRREHELDPETVRQLVASRIGPFMGSRAARKVLESVAPNNQNLFAVVEPVLGEFLGRSAAASLVDHVVESAIVKG